MGTTTTTTARMFMSIKLPQSAFSSSYSPHRNHYASSLCQPLPKPAARNKEGGIRLSAIAAAARLQIWGMTSAYGEDRGELTGMPKFTLSIHVGAILMFKPPLCVAIVPAVLPAAKMPFCNREVLCLLMWRKLQPALAITGVNNEEALIWVITQMAIFPFWYFLIMPPIIMNWLRIRWYMRNLLEMCLQFIVRLLVFPRIVFSRVLLWAPFLNFRKYPRDPSLKYPWSEPEDPSRVKNAFLKYPFAQPEVYD